MNIKKVIKNIFKVGTVGGIIGGFVYLGQKSLKKETILGKRYKSYYELTNQWIMNKNKNKDIARYFVENNIKTIAIYGMGTLCELFFEDIKKTDIKVSYFIDKNVDELYYGLDNISVIGIDDIRNQENVDAIIITPIFDYESILQDLQDIDTRIISLEDIIYEM